MSETRGGMIGDRATREKVIELLSSFLCVSRTRTTHAHVALPGHPKKKKAREELPRVLLLGCAETELVGGRRGRPTRSLVMMGFDFGNDRRDVGIGLDHGGVHFVTHGMHLGLEFVALFFARLARLFHLIHHSLFFRAQTGICRHGRFVGLVQFLPFSVGKEVHPVMRASGRRAWRRRIR